MREEGPEGMKHEWVKGGRDILFRRHIKGISLVAIILLSLLTRLSAPPAPPIFSFLFLNSLKYWRRDSLARAGRQLINNIFYLLISVT